MSKKITIIFKKHFPGLSVIMVILTGVISPLQAPPRTYQHWGGGDAVGSGMPDDTKCTRSLLEMYGFSFRDDIVQLTGELFLLYLLCLRQAHQN